MGDFIAAVETEIGLRGWRLPDGFAAEAADEAGLRAALGPDLPLLRSSGAARTVPTALTVAPTRGEGQWQIAPLRQDQPGGQVDTAAIAAAGALRDRPNWDGIVCVLGATSSWLHVSAGELISFQNFASGRIAAAFADGSGDMQARAEIFDEVLSTTMSRPERLAAQLAAPDLGPDQLWGALIGAELAAAKPYWLGQMVILIGEGAVQDAYRHALTSQGVMVELQDKDAMLRAGFEAHWALLEEMS